MRVYSALLRALYEVRSQIWSGIRKIFLIAGKNEDRKKAGSAARFLPFIYDYHIFPRAYATKRGSRSDRTE